MTRFDKRNSTLFTVGRLQDALEYAAHIEASKIEVTGYRAASLLSNGEQFAEAGFIARRRAVTPLQ